MWTMLCESRNTAECLQLSITGHLVWKPMLKSWGVFFLWALVLKSGIAAVGARRWFPGEGWPPPCKVQSHRALQTPPGPGVHHGC